MEAVRDGFGAIVDFLVVDANAAACTYNGLAREELVGTRLLGLLPGHAESGLLDRYARVIETGVALDLAEYRYHHELLRESRLYDIHAVKVGEKVGCAWRDVTEDRARWGAGTASSPSRSGQPSEVVAGAGAGGRTGNPGRSAPPGCARSRPRPRSRCPHRSA